MPSEISDNDLRRIYAEARTIAVVGASGDPAKPAHQVPAYLKQLGYRIVPVNPRGGRILAEDAATSLGEVGGPIDVVDVFRPSEETPEIARQAVAAGARVLWLQEGVHSDEAERIARDGGLTFVSDRCMRATHARLGLGPRED